MAVATSPTSAVRALDLSNTHPMDSSRLFIALLNLVQDGNPSPARKSGSSLIAAPTFRRLLSALHYRDANTLKHSCRVGVICVGIASRLGWESDDLRIIEIAALIHDIGKIGIPDHILRKPGKLSPDEAEFIATYHRVAITLLQACQVHPDITGIIAQSHGIAHESRSNPHLLSLGARILAVADAYDSLTTKQAFREPLNRFEALQTLERQSGKQFDRNVISALGRWLDGSDALQLADEQAFSLTSLVNEPIDHGMQSTANELCYLFHHLYLLETLYDAYYVIGSDRQVLIWSTGAATLFGLSSKEAMKTKWKRQIVSPTYATTDPIDQVFLNSEAMCHSMTIKEADDSCSDVDVQTLPILAEDGQVSGVVELICNNKESKRYRGQFRTLQLAATRDALTGVFNRGELERQLTILYEQWNGDQRYPFSVVFMDIDHFKSINDKYSHAVGDLVLTECARLIQDDLYSGEIIARYGGEEFIILCPETDAETARWRAERLRRALLAKTFADIDGLSVTASFGIAEVEADDTASSVMARADASLYDAKRTGRNRICVAESKPQVDKAGRVVRNRSSGPLKHSATIQTCVAGELLQMKFTGFVESYRAKVLKVESRRLEIQMGSTGFLANLSRSGLERIPVRMQIEITDLPSVAQSYSSQMLLKVRVEPVSSQIDEDRFLLRADNVVQQLRSYMMGT